MANKLEGEGSYEGTRRYQEGVRKHVEAGRVRRGAKRAKEALDDDAEREKLEAAERAVKNRPSE